MSEGLSLLGASPRLNRLKAAFARDRGGEEAWQHSQFMQLFGQLRSCPAAARGGH